MKDKIVGPGLLMGIQQDLGRDFVDAMKKNEDGKITYETLNDAIFYYNENFDNLAAPKHIVEMTAKDLGRDFIDSIEKNENGKITNKALEDALYNREFGFSAIETININDEDTAPKLVLSAIQAKFGKEIIDEADIDNNGIITNIEIKNAVNKALSNEDTNTLLSYEDIDKLLGESLDKKALDAVNLYFNNENDKKILSKTILNENIEFADKAKENIIKNLFSYERYDLSKILLDKVV